jgi:hypothetical protein
MSRWHRERYGDPCAQCGFAWAVDLEGALDAVAAIPGAISSLCELARGDERRDGLEWPVVAYVCHVGDNLRISAERLVGAPTGSALEVTPYDQDRLAAARRYEGVPLAGALWALARAAEDWRHAVTDAAGRAVLLVHPIYGELTVLDVARGNAHDAEHHRWDIERILAG